MTGRSMNINVKYDFFSFIPGWIHLCVDKKNQHETEGEMLFIKCVTTAERATNDAARVTVRGVQVRFIIDIVIYRPVWETK